MSTLLEIMQRLNLIEHYAMQLEGEIDLCNFAECDSCNRVRAAIRQNLTQFGANIVSELVKNETLMILQIIEV